ncbi:hypothetical protein CJP74_04810 [Psittacicella melopsittaci]|uniref:Lipoprotein n=1 Tax=Psittacicella melopsittaci TaxID=2028576 RepID=A0A3A1Y4K0_9GAMM|nr:hypothetical protein [Psittacicella melopsittaci]RIY32320.1 hypothetical protein CJP74_04810 [Psittacicella melopsittaci]
MMRLKSLVLALIVGAVLASCDKPAPTTNNVVTKNTPNRLVTSLSIRLDENQVVDDFANLNQDLVTQFYKTVEVRPLVSLAESKNKDGSINLRSVYKDGLLHLSYAIKNISDKPISKVYLDAVVNFAIAMPEAPSDTGEASLDNSSTNFFLQVPIVYDQSYKLTDVTQYNLNAYNPQLTPEQAPNYLLPGQIIVVTMDYNLQGLKTLPLVPEFIKNTLVANIGFNGFFTIPLYIQEIDGTDINTRDFPLPPPPAEQQPSTGE